MLEKTEREIKNGQFIDTGNINNITSIIVTHNKIRTGTIFNSGKKKSHTEVSNTQVQNKRKYKICALSEL
jgi:hypothetical protein